MKEFLVYTLMRIALFVAAFALIAGIFVAFTGGVPVFWAVLLAFVLSGVGSYFLLARQRATFGAKVEERAGRAAQRFEQARSKEDVD